MKQEEEKMRKENLKRTEQANKWNLKLKTNLTDTNRLISSVIPSSTIYLVLLLQSWTEKGGLMVRLHSFANDDHKHTHFGLIPRSRPLAFVDTKTSQALWNRSSEWNNNGLVQLQAAPPDETINFCLSYTRKTFFCHT